ncbi:MAG: DNA cytosine methyltransferase [Candidatus Accumulibacter sp.]|nr:DNA cytosine methyltransferase [Accumulibacter sp.]
MGQDFVRAYYNEIDKHAAAWLRELIKAGHIAPGEVDERSIEDVLPSDLAGFNQCHWFAGIGVWSYALRRAGWPDHRPVWTGSCPCQPFSQAGKGSAFADERHLWPAFHHLIKECRPPVVFGEQVASSAINPWVDLVHADLEAVGYAFGCVPFPSASVGAPHIRDRAYWVADAGSKRLEGRKRSRERIDAQRETAERSCEVIRLGNSAIEPCERNAGSVFRAEKKVNRKWGNDGGLHIGSEHAGAGLGRLADANSSGLVTGSEGRPTARHGQAAKPDCCAVGVADASGERRQQIAGSAPFDEEADGREGRDEQQPHGDNVAASACEVHGHQRPGPTNGFWRDADWLGCRDGKWRPVEPGLKPLAHGLAARVVRLRGYGNAINAVQAQTFIAAFLETAA